MQGLLTVKEAASYLGVSPCTVYRCVEGSEIRFIKKPSALYDKHRPNPYAGRQNLWRTGPNRFPSGKGLEV